MRIVDVVLARGQFVSPCGEHLGRACVMMSVLSAVSGYEIFYANTPGVQYRLEPTKRRGHVYTVSRAVGLQILFFMLGPKVITR